MESTPHKTWWPPGFATSWRPVRTALFTTVGLVDGQPDVILYDVIGLESGDTSELERLVQETAAVTIAVSYDGLRPDLEALALDRGAAAVIPLRISADQLSEVIGAAIEGHLDDMPTVQTPEDSAFPGKAHGLSRRESEVLALIVKVGATLRSPTNAS